jgi:hypothetical protein
MRTSPAAIIASSALPALSIGTMSSTIRYRKRIARNHFGNDARRVLFERPDSKFSHVLHCSSFRKPRKFGIRNVQTTGQGHGARSPWQRRVDGNGNVPVPVDAPDLLFCICENHRRMTGNIRTVDAPTKFLGIPSSVEPPSRARSLRRYGVVTSSGTMSSLEARPPLSYTRA